MTSSRFKRSPIGVYFPPGEDGFGGMTEQALIELLADGLGQPRDFTVSIHVGDRKPESPQTNPVAGVK